MSLFLTWYAQLPSDGVVKGISEGQLWAFVVLVVAMGGWMLHVSWKIDGLVSKLDLREAIDELKGEIARDYLADEDCGSEVWRDRETPPS
jgi:hypothetical protein